jgi:hypothetical protein
MRYSAYISRHVELKCLLIHAFSGKPVRQKLMEHELQFIPNRIKMLCAYVRKFFHIRNFFYEPQLFTCKYLVDCLITAELLRGSVMVVIYGSV